MMDARGFASTVIISEPVVAHFEQGGLLDHEIEAALSSFSFSGLAEGVNPLTKIAFFDTEAFVESFPEEQRNELQVRIDKRLTELAERFPNQFIRVDAPMKPRPWNSYDDDTVDEILEFQKRLRVKPEDVRLYEIENRNRFEIVHEMLRQEDPEGAALFAAELEKGEESVEGHVVATISA